MTPAEEKKLIETVKKQGRTINLLLQRLCMKPTEADWEAAMLAFMAGDPSQLASCVDREGIQL